jgi:hypothetical protein
MSHHADIAAISFTVRARPVPHQYGNVASIFTCEAQEKVKCVSATPAPLAWLSDLVSAFLHVSQPRKDCQPGRKCANSALDYLR